MRQSLRSFTTSTCIILSLTACSKDQKNPPAPVSEVTSSSSSSLATAITTDKWLGKWNGPEGTFLEITGGSGSYQITIQTLDGPTTYEGASMEDEIKFERDEKHETIRATNGAETGMKWLSDKSNCLTIKKGEGYCKD